MATLLLASAGAALGATAGPAGALLGRAAGAVLGGALDQRLLGGGARAVETGRLSRIRVQGAQEGAPVARLYGRMRLPAQVIWSSRFREEVSETGGGKGGPPRVRSHRYSVSLALALCEGPIDRIGRIWADGRLIDPASLDLRLHHGDEDQTPDPLIAAIEGEAATPAYRGVAYAVLSDLDLSPFGNRIPQFNIEAFRQPPSDRPGLRALVEAVALSPGSGEFALDTTPVRRRLGPGRAVSENVNTAENRPDALVALDQLAEEAPACGATSLVVSWFGDDLRMGRCRIRPAVETRDKTTEPRAWTVSGLTRETAPVVGQRDGRPVYGGAPDDASVVNAIREMRARGLHVMFYPFILMDIASGSGLPDPYGGAEQPAYPWRGRITLDVAPGRPGSTDRTPAAAADVDAFFGGARPGDFTRVGDTVRYDGPEDWGLRRFILHYAHLCAAAGGVDSFCIGSELRGLTAVRAGGGAYPAVQALRALAADVRAILGPAVKIGYAADWSEYFGHQPGDGDVVFHLDPLWADPAIDFVGIDNYMPLSDWRDGADHADASAGSVHDRAYLQRNIEGGEGFDWYYASAEDRAAQRRTPIADGAHGEPWVFRYKDLRNWWSRPHHDRIAGVRSDAPTPWVPMSKPIWFTEIGCPAVDKGANQPNVFVDPKSSESALPHFSSGAPDEQMQRSFLEAALDYWRDPARNPVSPRYGGPMIDTRRSFVWTWDLRPWPDFPRRLGVWSDGDNHRLGHWITGRLGGASLDALVAEICADAGLADADVAALRGVVDGYVQDAPQTARQALQPLMLAFGFDAAQAGGRLTFRPRAETAALHLSAGALVDDDAAPRLTWRRASAQAAPAAMRLAYAASDAAYEPAAAEAQDAGAPVRTVEATEAPIAMRAEQARAVVERWRLEAGATGEEARFALPPSLARLGPGDIVTLDIGAARAPFRIERVEDGPARGVHARRVAAAAPAVPAAVAASPPLAAPPLRQPVEALLVDSPTTSDAEAPALLAFAFADPWPGPVYARRLDAEGAAGPVLIDRPATMGVLADPLPAAAPHRWARGGVTVQLFGGALTTGGAAAALRGVRRAALQSPLGGWEAIDVAEATLIGPDRWRLEAVLRGQRGTEHLIAAVTPAGARLVLLDDAGVALPLFPEDVGETVRAAFWPAHLPPDGPETVTVETRFADAARRPFAPAHLRAARRPDGAVALSWVGRSRDPEADVWTSAEAEQAARFRVTVAAGDAALRIVDVAAPAFVYDAAMQAADGAVAPLSFAVTTLSPVFGAGPHTGIIFDD